MLEMCYAHPCVAGGTSSRRAYLRQSSVVLAKCTGPTDVIELPINSAQVRTTDGLTQKHSHLRAFCFLYV